MATFLFGFLCGFAATRLFLSVRDAEPWSFILLWWVLMMTAEIALLYM
jgi:hypothetical protein